MSKLLFFRRIDGVVGVGFQIEFGGIEQYSIAWPDRAGERHSLDVARKIGIVVEVAPEGLGPSDLLVSMAQTENPPPFTATPELPTPEAAEATKIADEAAKAALDAKAEADRLADEAAKLAIEAAAVAASVPVPLSPPEQVPTPADPVVVSDPVIVSDPVVVTDPVVPPAVSLDPAVQTDPV